jgi:hypothetical protein
MTEKTYELKFYNFGVKREDCFGPNGDFQPPQKILSRDGRMRKTEVGVTPPTKILNAFKEIRIVACPQLKGTICTRDTENRHCINPYTISNPAELATKPIETTITFRSNEDLLIIE